jgi:hypothetical protein
MTAACDVMNYRQHCQVRRLPHDRAAQVRRNVFRRVLGHMVRCMPREQCKKPPGPSAERPSRRPSAPAENAKKLARSWLERPREYWGCIPTKTEAGLFDPTRDLHERNCHGQCQSGATVHKIQSGRSTAKVAEIRWRQSFDFPYRRIHTVACPPVASSATIPLATPTRRCGIFRWRFRRGSGAEPLAVFRWHIGCGMWNHARRNLQVGPQEAPANRPAAAPPPRM